MSKNKLVDKTNKVFDAQLELSTLLEDLKSEVKAVYYENKQLSQENQQLKDQIARYQQQSPADLQNLPTQPIQQEVAVEPQAQEVAVDPAPVQAVQQSVPPLEQSLPYREEVQEPRKPKEPNPIMEFFLGKNIIAKIAAVLIFLGIITFGQMAYDWLPDIGRFLLILFTGSFFFGVAVLMERKKAIVFSNVFYTIGLAIIYYSFILATFGFELFGTSVLSYILILLIASTIYFFREKRYEFLDITLYIFYLVAGLSYLFYDHTGFVISHYIELFLLIGLLGYVQFKYFTDYIKDDERAKLLSQLVLIIASITIVLSAYNLGQNQILDSITILLYASLACFSVYLINYTYYPKKTSQFPLIIPIFSTIILILTSIAYLAFIDLAFGLANNANILLIFLLSISPLYTYLYLKRSKDYPLITKYYVVILATSLLLYSLAAGPLNLYQSFSFYILNIISAVSILLFFVLSKLTKDTYHRYIAYVFIAVLLFRNAGYHLSDGGFVFTNSNVLFVTIGLGVALLGVNLFYRYKQQQEVESDYLVVNAFNVIALIPFVMTFTNDLLSDDNAYIMAMVMVLLIGYRWLMELDPFKMLHKKHFVLGMNISILALTFALNLFYFDHDFSRFEDVFKFVFLLTVNVYNVYSLREIYIGYGKFDNQERNFILLYGVGVLIHSFFIHNYINIEFDKVILSSYFLIASAVGVLAGFRQGWSLTRKIGLGAIYYSLGKFFIYDFYTQDFSSFVRMMTYFILGFILLGISFLYAYLERTYGTEQA